MRKHLHWVVAAALVCVTPLAAQDGADALVVRLQGDVQVRRGGGAPAPLTVGERLEAGDQLAPASGARAILITSTGAQQIVTQPTTVSAVAGGAHPDLWERAMGTLAQAATADARGAGGRQGMIRPIPGEPVIVAPRNGLTVASTRPAFSWMEVPGAGGYLVQIRPLDGGQLMRHEATETPWSLPEDAPALIPGVTYAWTVAPRDGRPTREERFTVIGSEAYGDLEAALSVLSEMKLDPTGDGLFLAAIEYRNLELYYDAAAALAAVESAGPVGADVYLLKGEILNVLGREEEARKAFDRADEIMR